jgi:hypothetical protein
VKVRLAQWLSTNSAVIESSRKLWTGDINCRFETAERFTVLLPIQCRLPYLFLTSVDVYRIGRVSAVPMHCVAVANYNNDYQNNNTLVRI